MYLGGCRVARWRKGEAAGGSGKSRGPRLRAKTRRLSSRRRKPEQTGRRERDLNALQPCLEVTVSYCSTVADHDRQVLFFVCRKSHLAVAGSSRIEHPLAGTRKDLLDIVVLCCRSNEGRRRRLALPCNAIAMDANKEARSDYLPLPYVTKPVMM